MSTLGHSRPVDPSDRERGMSALPQKRTNGQTSRYVRLVPKADIRIAASCRLFDHLVGARVSRGPRLLMDHLGPSPMACQAHRERGAIYSYRPVT